MTEKTPQPQIAAPSSPEAWHTLPNAPARGTALLHRDLLQDGQVLMHREPFPLLLLRSGATITAFANRCAHFGVPLAGKQEHLIFEPHVSLTCNVHYARFRWSDGVCDRGDCEGDALIPVPVQVDADGMVRIAAED